MKTDSPRCYPGFEDVLKGISTFFYNTTQLSKLLVCPESFMSIGQGKFELQHFAPSRSMWSVILLCTIWNKSQTDLHSYGAFMITSSCGKSMVCGMNAQQRNYVAINRQIRNTCEQDKHVVTSCHQYAGRKRTSPASNSTKTGLRFMASGNFSTSGSERSSIWLVMP